MSMCSIGKVFGRVRAIKIEKPAKICESRGNLRKIIVETPRKLRTFAFVYDF